jgi:hypothetical protein
VTDESPTEVTASMMLCDAAQAVGGKLFILGGGWTHLWSPPGQPLPPMALAIRINIPWSMTNEPIPVRMYLITAEGEAVDVGQGPIQALANVEVGRPAGLRRGTPLVAVLALNAGQLPLEPGGYVWELAVNDKVLAREPFETMKQPLPQFGGPS